MSEYMRVSEAAEISGYKRQRIYQMIAEGLVACLIITITQDQIPLQNMSILAVFVTYFLTCCAAFVAAGKGFIQVHRWIAVCAGLICSAVMILCMINIIKFGLSVAFLALFLGGCTIAFFRHKRHSIKSQ